MSRNANTQPTGHLWPVDTRLHSNSGQMLVNVMKHKYETGNQTICDEPSDENAEPQGNIPPKRAKFDARRRLGTVRHEYSSQDQTLHQHFYLEVLRHTVTYFALNDHGNGSHQASTTFHRCVNLCWPKGMAT